MSAAVARCSALSIDEPLPGTAPVARWWWLLEVPGAWGHDAVAECDIPAVRELRSTPERRVLLVRRPGRHPADSSRALRVWVAGTFPQDPPTRVAVLADPAELLEWDPLAPPAEALEVDPQAPVLAVCTNAKRDACCGLDGRALIGQLPDVSRVWECSHLGGHRFAPTALHVPSGMVYGRLDGAASLDVIAGDIRWDRLRGRSGLTPELQAAEWALGSAGHAVDPATWRTDDPAGFADGERGTVARATDGAGREWVVQLSEQDVPSRPPSCGTEPEPATAWIPRLST